MSQTIKELKTGHLNEVLGQLIDFTNKYSDKGHPDKACPVRKGIAVMNIHNETVGTVNIKILAHAPCSCGRESLFWNLGTFSARIADQILYFKEMLPHTVKAVLVYLQQSKELNKWNTGYLVPITELISLLNLVLQGIDQI